MERGAWQATVHGVARVGHDLATTPPTPESQVLRVQALPAPKGICKTTLSFERK